MHASDSAGPPQQVLDALAETGTPAYVYDLAHVRRNYSSLRSALPGGTRLFYSLKANTHPALLGQLRRSGAQAEICSTGELRAALAAGWPADHMLYTGPGKRDEEVSTALRHGVRLFSVDTPRAIDQIDELAAKQDAVAQCILRVNEDRPARGQSLAMSGVASQFGADIAWIKREPEDFRSREHARVTGLHLYQGSNILGVVDLVDQFAGSLRTAREVGEALAPHGVRLELLDLGGGFGCPFAKGGEPPDLTGLATPLEQLLDAETPGWRRRRPLIAFESGRYLVASAGTLFAAVADAKQSHGRSVVVLESGINHLGGMSGLRRLPPLIPQLARVAGRERRADETAQADPVVDTLVAGPLCTPLDTWARSAPLPRLRVGDLLSVPNVGAYGLSASLLAFLAHPAPAEIVIDGERPGLPAQASRVELVRTHLPHEATNRGDG